MKRHNPFWIKVFAFLCVILISVYASLTFLPHAHGEDIHIDCALCAIIEASQRTLLALTPCAIAYTLISFALIIQNKNTYFASSRDGTPVGLKVKLSD